jgi:hypothetical protein
VEVLHGPQPLPNSPTHSCQIHPLANAIRCHWPGTKVDILPIVISRTGTPHTSTIASLTSLLTLRLIPLTNSSRKHDSTHPASLHNSTGTLSNGYTISYSYTAANPARPLAALPHTAPSHAPNCTLPPPRIAHSPGGSKTQEHPLERLDFGG